MINVKFYNYCEFYNAQPAQLQWCSSTDFQAWACPQPFAQWDHMPPCVWFFHSSYPCDNIMLNWSPSSPKIKFSEVSCKQTPIVHARGRYQNAVLSFPPVGQSCSPSQLLAPWPPAALTEVTLSPGCSQSNELSWDTSAGPLTHSYPGRVYLEAQDHRERKFLGTALRSETHPTEHSPHPTGMNLF